MVRVRMRIDDGDDGPLAELLVCELQGCRGRLLHQQDVENDPARDAPDQGHVGQVVTAHLVDLAGHDLVETVVHVQCRLPLQRRVDAVQRLAGQQEIVLADVPDGFIGVVGNAAIRRRRDEPPAMFLEVPAVVERQCLAGGLLQCDRVARRRLAGRGIGRVCVRSARGRQNKQEQGKGSRYACFHVGITSV